MPKDATDLYVDIGKAIHRQRTSAKPVISQQRLANAVGLSRASIVNIERGRHRIQIDVLYDIAMALGVDAHSLLPTVGNSSVAAGLPSDFKDELDSKELAAIGRLLTPSRGSADAKS